LRLETSLKTETGIRPETLGKTGIMRPFTLHKNHSPTDGNAPAAPESSDQQRPSPDVIPM